MAENLATKTTLQVSRRSGGKSSKGRCDLISLGEGIESSLPITSSAWKAAVFYTLVEQWARVSLNMRSIIRNQKWETKRHKSEIRPTPLSYLFIRSDAHHGHLKERGSWEKIFLLRRHNVCLVHQKPSDFLEQDHSQVASEMGLVFWRMTVVVKLLIVEDTQSIAMLA